ncbi:hypothetical protein QUB00_32395 [Microcoleus sp. F8_C2]
MLVGSWQLAVGSWQLAVGSWQLLTFNSQQSEKLLLLERGTSGCAIDS